jgi:hypothetical protein
MVFLWACVLLTYFAYWFELTDANEICQEVGLQYDYVRHWKENVDALGCEIMVSIFRWLVFFLSFFGLVMVVLASMGNDVDCRKWYWPALGSITVLLFTVIPFGTHLGETSGHTESGYLMVVSLSLGLVVCVYHWSHVLSLWTPDAWLQKHCPVLRERLNPSTIRSESHGKYALAFKLNRITQNALDIMNSDTDNDLAVTTNFGRGLYFYSKCGRQWKTAGGLLWTWQHIRDKSLFREKGIWYSARLLASNICQYVVAIYILWQGIALTKRVVQDYDQEDAQSQVDLFMQYVFTNAVDDEQVDSFAANVTALVTTLVGSTSDSLNCSAGKGQDILDQYCRWTSQLIFECDSNESVNYLCGLLGGGGGQPRRPTGTTWLVERIGV